MKKWIARVGRAVMMGLRPLTGELGPTIGGPNLLDNAGV